MPSLFDLLRPRPREDRLERAIRDGERYLRERQYAAAERAFDFATGQNPADPRAYLGLAVLHHTRGERSRADEALSAYRDAVLAQKISDEEQAALLAQGYERLGDTTRAEDA